MILTGDFTIFCFQERERKPIALFLIATKLVALRLSSYSYFRWISSEVMLSMTLP